ncbi:endonuclease domain-containing protein [Sphingomonas sp.]|uniref:endonuclease domain-containing protein n=1 Tax=Sphingomonas sp. TaxID=28214 RepID=UPI0035C81348
MFNATAAARTLAHSQRRSGNLSEVLLWRALRTRPGGFKFRRQHPLGDYSLDFACLSARLCIEVYGEHHARCDQPARDAARDLTLAALGFRVLRMRARDILADIDAAVRGSVAACHQPLHHSAAPNGPPPRAGEVFNREAS